MPLLFKELKEFTVQQLATLKKEYEPMRGKTISIPNANKMNSMLDRMTKDMLRKLANADIPFISTGAASKLVTKHGMKFTDFKLNMSEADELQQEACWTGYKQVGFKKKGDRRVPNCVPESVVREMFGDMINEINDLRGSFSDARLERMKQEWKNKPASAMTQGVKQMIMNLDAPTRAALENAKINHISKFAGSTFEQKESVDPSCKICEGEACQCAQGEDIQEAEENNYTVVHADHGKEVIKATSSYGAAKKYADMKKLKSTAGVDAHLMEGYKVLPKVDTDKYPEIPGLEGPFQTMAGKPIYYDPKEGSYYDKDTDMYLTYDEFQALDNDRTGMKEASMPVNATTKMHKLGVQEDAPISQMSRADLLDYLNMSEKDAEGISTQELMDMAQDVTMDQMEQKKALNIKLPGHLSKVTRFKSEGKNKMGPQGIAPGDRVEHEGDMYEVVAVDGDILTVNNLQNGNRTKFRMDDVTPLFGADAMTDQDEEDLGAMFKRLKKAGSGSLKHVATEGDGRKKGIHPKGHPMRQKQQAAIHANSVDLNAMRNALKLDESVDTNTVVAEYTRACLDLSHNTWGKVCEQIDHVRSFVKEDIDIENVKIQIRKMHEQEGLDHKILVKENVDKLRQIVKDKSAMSIKFADGSMKVDMTTASIFLQVFDKVKEETQAKIVDRIQTKQGFLSILDKMYSMIG